MHGSGEFDYMLPSKGFSSWPPLIGGLYGCWEDSASHARPDTPLAVGGLHIHRLSAAVRFQDHPDFLVCRAKTRHTSLALYVLIRGLSLLIRCGNKPSASPVVRRCGPRFCPCAAHHHQYLNFTPEPVCMCGCP